VVLLLFEVGIEVDLWRLRREHGQIIWAAPVQVLTTTVISATVVMALGIALVPAVEVGLAIASPRRSPSSTARAAGAERRIRQRSARCWVGARFKTSPA
jgi:Kef-type K+ transport system membrane component KefB